jgi:BirA family transcriptional regulator, biotin operon repressor / biotin---[acetyl-CoA-carboxylase] ligase
MALGLPHLHLRATTSTNDRARELAGAGAGHGTLVTAAEQSSGRGRQGRTWSAPAGHALLMSVVVRRQLELLPLAAGLAVARAVGDEAAIKWPNDVIVDRALPRKIAGILVEGRPQEGWAVIGIGLNVAVRIADLPAELRDTAATLGLEPAAIGAVRDRVLAELDTALALDPGALLDAYRERDVLLGRPVTWASGSGTAAGIDGTGRLVVALPGGGRTTLDAGEVHLGEAVLR